MPEMRKCRWCGDQRECVFLSWECHRNTCKRPSLNETWDTPHVHAMWVCDKCRQLTLFEMA